MNTVSNEITEGLFINFDIFSFDNFEISDNFLYLLPCAKAIQGKYPSEKSIFLLIEFGKFVIKLNTYSKSLIFQIIFDIYYFGQV